LEAGDASPDEDAADAAQNFVVRHRRVQEFRSRTDGLIAAGTARRRRYLPKNLGIPRLMAESRRATFQLREA